MHAVFIRLRGSSAIWLRGSSAVGRWRAYMPVLPGSLHSALGSKHALFLRALRDYVKDTHNAADALTFDGAPLSAIRALLEAVLEAASETPGRGCMLGNSATELLPTDEATRQIVQSGFHALEQGIELALLAAQRSGEVREDLDCAMQSRLLVAPIQGLHVTARAEPDPHRFDDVIDTVLDSMTLPV